MGVWLVRSVVHGGWLVRSVVHGGVASPVSGACVVGLVKSMVDEVANHSVVVKVLVVINFPSLSNYDLIGIENALL